MVSNDQALSILNVIRKELYTPYGLRTLAPNEDDFHGYYEGAQVMRDMAYHQGTVWPYPMGAYFSAYLKWMPDKNKATDEMKQLLNKFSACLYEGCLGHIAEVYDGLEPSVSTGG